MQKWHPIAVLVSIVYNLTILIITINLTRLLNIAIHKVTHKSRKSNFQNKILFVTHTTNSTVLVVPVQVPSVLKWRSPGI